MRMRFILITEGIGEDIPKNVDFSLIDGFTKVTDKDAAVYTEKLLEEGISLGTCWGCHKGIITTKGAFKPEDVVVVLFHDSEVVM
jgi:cystathionine beta-synthase